MPNPLSETQTRQVKEEVARQIIPIRVQQRRLAIWLCCVLAGVVIGATSGIYFYSRSIGYARSVSCQRGQAVSVALALVVHTAIPPHKKHRTQAEQRQVDAFYHKVAPALKVPSCN